MSCVLTVQLGPLHPSHLPCRYVSSLSCDKSGSKTCISSSSHFATSNMIICFMTSLSSSTTSHVRSGAAVNMCSIPHFSSLSFKTSFCHQKTPCDTEGLHQPSQHTFASFAWAQHQLRDKFRIVGLQTDSWFSSKFVFMRRPWQVTTVWTLSRKAYPMTKSALALF